jgi:putative ABC transport system permease protein
VRIFKLVFRNSWRHPLRSMLTVLGMAIAVMAFAVIRTSIAAWYSGAEASSPDRLVTSNEVSIIFTLPVAYEQKIKNVAGVKSVSCGQWFGGYYVDPKNFFAKFAVNHHTYFDMYPEFLIDPQQKEQFFAERNAVIVGRKLADRFGWKIGDRINITGDIFPGQWDFILRGIYTGAEETTDETAFLFRWDYLDERMRAETPMRSGQVGWYIVQIDDPARAAEIKSMPCSTTHLRKQKRRPRKLSRWPSSSFRPPS